MIKIITASGEHTEKLRIPNEIMEGEFSGRDDIIEIVIPKTVKNIYRCAFSNCKLLKKVILPENLVTMGENVFEDCISLESITIPGSLKIIPRFAFRYCINLKEINIGNGVEIINEDAFAGSSFESIIIPDSIKKLDHHALFSTAIKTVTIGKNVIMKETSLARNFPKEYKLQNREAGTYVQMPNGKRVNRTIKGQLVQYLSWVPQKQVNQIQSAGNYTDLSQPLVDPNWNINQHTAQLIDQIIPAKGNLKASAVLSHPAFHEAFKEFIKMNNI